MQTTTVTSEDSFIPAPAVNGDFNHSPLIVDGMQLRLSEERLETDLRESSRPRAAPFVPASQCTAQPIDSNGKEHANEVEIVMDMATQAEPISKECQAPRRNAFYRWISRKAKVSATDACDHTSRTVAAHSPDASTATCTCRPL